MKFEVFTIVRNKKMEHLLFEFQARVGVSKVLKRNFPGLTDEQIESMEKRNAGYWNDIARLLLTLDYCESEEEVIDECFKVLGKGNMDDVLELTKRALKNKDARLKNHLTKTVSVKSTSENGMYALCYLKKMYEELEPAAMSYVDEKLKGKMDERLKLLE